MARRRGTVYACPDKVRRCRRERPAEPVRTCVGCRTRAAASGLLRVVAVDGTLVPDPRRRCLGRGAWVHPDVGCLRLAERRRAFPRALRLAGELDATAVHAVVTETYGVPGSLGADARDRPGARFNAKEQVDSEMYPQS